MTHYDEITAAADAIRTRARVVPTIAIVLGSGLGPFADRVSDAVSIPYADLPHWPVPRVPGHAGRLVLGKVSGRDVAVLSGRVHAYEGHDFKAVAFGVRALACLGVKTLVLTNAAGGVNEAFSPGSLMLIDDHINLMGGSPLVGLSGLLGPSGLDDGRFGAMFPEMNEVYSSRLRTAARDVASLRELPLVHGVYAACLGPSYETPAEIRYLRVIGADAVGMSTVPEALAARQMGLEVLGISVITNMAAGLACVPPDHTEVLATALGASGAVITLVEDIIGRL